MLGVYVILQISVLVVRQRRSKCQQLLWLKQGVLVAKVGYRSNHQSGSNQQQQCKRHFSHNERAAQLVNCGTGPCSPESLFQSLIEINPRSLECGCQSED